MSWRAGLKHHSLIANDELKEEYKELLAVVKQEYEETIKAEVREISGTRVPCKDWCANYIDNVKSLYSKGKSKTNLPGRMKIQTNG